MLVTRPGPPTWLVHETSSSFYLFHELACLLIKSQVRRYRVEGQRSLQ
jgi:hypothetical protein